MRQIRIAKRRTRAASWQPEPLRPDPRDPDIVHSHQLARRARVPGGAARRPGGYALTRLIPGRRQNGSEQSRHDAHDRTHARRGDGDARNGCPGSEVAANRGKRSLGPAGDGETYPG